jgi:hypothetical protein
MYVAAYLSRIGFSISFLFPSGNSVFVLEGTILISDFGMDTSLSRLCILRFYNRWWCLYLPNEKRTVAGGAEYVLSADDILLMVMAKVELQRI